MLLRRGRLWPWAARLALVLALILIWQPVASGQQPVRAASYAPGSAADLDQMGHPVDPSPVRTYPSTDVEIQRWIDAFDMPRIRAHGWDLWESITSDSGQGNLPVWETWYSGQEIFGKQPPPQPQALATKARPTFRAFERARQVGHSGGAGGIPIDAAEQILAFNRYSTSLANYIVDHGFNDATTLLNINNVFDDNNTPLPQRVISTSAGPVDASEIVLKPVFQFISGDRPTAVSYWAGLSPQTTTNIAVPVASTWRQCVVIDPTGQHPVGSTVVMPCNAEPPAPLPVVSLDNFYYIVMTKAQADSYSEFAETSGDDLGAGNSADIQNIKAMVKEGNIALLMAMHTTTKEISNWTWQTFWWGYNPNDPVYGVDRPASIQSPWSHYNMDTAYFMVTPRGGGPWIAFNPYLETSLTGCVPAASPACVPPPTPSPAPVNWTGVHTNCMSCHRVASVGPPVIDRQLSSPAYWPDGLVSPDDPTLFAGRTKIDFLWSIQRARTRAADKPLTRPAN